MWMAFNLVKAFYVGFILGFECLVFLVFRICLVFLGFLNFWNVLYLRRWVKNPFYVFCFFFINLVQKSILLLSFLFLIFCLACHCSFINFLSIFPEARIISECCRILGFSKLVYKLFVFGDDDIH